MHSIDRPTTLILGALSALFAARVAVQAIQYVHDFDVLPAFERWQSGALPYWVLFVLQVAIVTSQIVILRGVADGCRLLWPSQRRAFRRLALIYLNVMIFRLIAGLTFADGNRWLDAKLPTIFHLVLASFLLVWTRYESVPARLLLDDDRRFDAHLGAQ
jgi:hypothetical protein